MDRIEFKANFGGKEKDVVLIRASGAADYWQIFIDKYYQGTLQNKGGVWRPALNRESKLTGDDLYVLIERLPDR